MVKKIGGYRIERRLGQGGMGEVFLAWDERLERRVAIKRIRHAGDVLPAPLRERFQREARLAARLSHPAIVQVYELITDESGDALVMEYVEGVTLKLRLAASPLKAAEALRLAHEIAGGLEAAHDAGLIHRDLKAENVIVTPAGHAKILDFGLARSLEWSEESLTQDGTVIGTLHTMSPEQARGEDLDARTDLFSFGVLLYEMLAGRSPFRGKNPLETLRRLENEVPPPLSSLRSDLPRSLSALVEELLAKDRGHRPDNVSHVVYRLERIARELSATEPSEEKIDSSSASDMQTEEVPVPWERPKPDSSKTYRRWVWALAGALVLALAAWLLFQARHPMRVLVMRPVIQEAGDQAQHLAVIGLTVEKASLASLRTRKGLAPLDPSSLIEGPSPSVPEAAHIAAADEVLTTKLVREDGMVHVSFSRITKDGVSLWGDNSIRIPLNTGSLQVLSGSVNDLLQKGFSEFPARRNTPQPEATAADYAQFFEIQRAIDTGEISVAKGLEGLDKVTRSSPRFADAWVKAAVYACNLFRASSEPSDLDKARFYLRYAHALDPNGRDTLRAEFTVALAGRDESRAKAALERLNEEWPDDPDVLVLRYRLAEYQENWAAAERFLRESIAEAPTWRSRYWLADLLAKRTQVDDARAILEQLQKEAPTNVWIRQKLAYLELIYGDLKQAVEIYSKLVAVPDPKYDDYSNLGLARSMLGQYEEAEAAFDKALNLRHGAKSAMLNLADTRRARGDLYAAHLGYSAVLEQLGSGHLLPRDEIIKAQCLVNLGQPEDAKEALRRALRHELQDPQLYIEAARVYTLAGDLPTALQYAKKAIHARLPLGWFDIPDFEPLRRESEFKALANPASRR